MNFERRSKFDDIARLIDETNNEDCRNRLSDIYDTGKRQIVYYSCVTHFISIGKQSFQY